MCEYKDFPALFWVSDAFQKLKKCIKTALLWLYRRLVDFICVFGAFSKFE